LITEFFNFPIYKKGDYILLKKIAIEEYYKRYNLYKFAKISEISGYSETSYVLEAIFNDPPKIMRKIVGEFNIPRDHIERKLNKREIEEFEVQKTAIMYNL